MNEVVYGALAIPYRKRDEKYDFLLLKHKSGMWTFPGGGKDEEDETLEDCLIRELSEEIGINVDKNDLKHTGLVNKFVYGPEKPARNGMKGETHFWLLELAGDEKFGSWDNIIDHGWFSAEKIVELLPFDDERKVFLKAIERIDN